MCLSVGVDEVFNNGDWLLCCGAPRLWLIPNNLVGILPVREAHDPHINKGWPAISASKLGHESQQLGGSECARLRSSRINVVRQENL